MSKKRPKRTPFEITLLVVSSLAIVAIVGGLVFSGLKAGGGPPDLRVSLKPLSEAGSYEVVIRNVGGTTAEHVVVSVKAGEESTEVEFPFVNKGDEERATVSIAGSDPNAEVASFSER